MTVYGRRPSETTLKIFRDVIDEIKTDPLNRKAAESMKYAPKQDSNLHKPRKSLLRRIK